MSNKLIMSAVLSVVSICLVGCGAKQSAGTQGASAWGGDETKSYAWRGDDAAVVKDSDGADRQGRLVNRMKAPANQTYYFDLDSNRINENDFAFIKLQAQYLNSHRNARVRLEGNTDSRGSREYNVGLGWRRDQSVARSLEQAGVRPSQVNMVSYGKESPAVLGDIESVFRLNRRVALVYEGY